VERLVEGLEGPLPEEGVKINRVRSEVSLQGSHTSNKVKVVELVETFSGTSRQEPSKGPEGKICCHLHGLS